jgi:uncharacterized protein involved in exopolysaccharide biosynthesis
MNKRVVRRLLETFFRRWWLYVLPLALFAMVGVAKGLDSGSGYQSVGVVDVSKGTLLSQLTSIRGDNFGYETPAAATARTMNSLLRTDQFIEAVAKAAGVTDAVKQGQLTPFELQQSIAASPDGDTLLQVVATTKNPELSARLAKGTIDSFIQYEINGDISDSRAAEAFFVSQLKTYGEALDAAQTALNDYAAKHPGGPLEQRPFAEQVEINTLTAAVTQAESQYTTAQQKSEEARLATEQAKSDASQRLRIIDEPKVPAGPTPRLKRAVFTFATFLFVGALISFGAVVLASYMDRSLRSAEDIEVLGLPVLAVVPEARSKRAGRHAKRAAQAPQRTVESARVAGTTGARRTPAVSSSSASRSGQTAVAPRRSTVRPGIGSWQDDSLTVAEPTGRSSRAEPRR